MPEFLLWGGKYALLEKLIWPAKVQWIIGVLFLIQIFYPETTDIYDRKNMPRCIYCIHALRYVHSGLLHSQSIGPLA